MDPVSAIRHILHCRDRRRLEALQAAGGIHDCDCPTIIAPCPVHGDQDCECSLFGRIIPCKHQVVTGRELPFAVQTLLLWLLHPDRYGVPQPPPERSKVLLKEAFVAVMAGRHAAGYRLRHARDYLRRRDWWDDPTEQLQAGRHVTRLRNGSVAPGRIDRIERRAA
jgi:hypothetical protein